MALDASLPRLRGPPTASNRIAHPGDRGAAGSSSLWEREWSRWSSRSWQPGTSPTSPCRSLAATRAFWPRREPSLLGYAFKAYGWRQLFAAHERPQALALAAANGGTSIAALALPGRFDDVVRIAIVRRSPNCPAGVKALCLSLAMLGLIDAVALAPLALAASVLPGHSIGVRVGLALLGGVGLAAASARDRPAATGREQAAPPLPARPLAASADAVAAGDPACVGTAVRMLAHPRRGASPHPRRARSRLLVDARAALPLRELGGSGAAARSRRERHPGRSRSRGADRIRGRSLRGRRRCGRRPGDRDPRGRLDLSRRRGLAHPFAAGAAVSAGSGSRHARESRRGTATVSAVPAGRDPRDGHDCQIFTAAEALTAYTASRRSGLLREREARNGGSDSRALQTWEDEGGPASQETA